jgi:hypothetical protein
MVLLKDAKTCTFANDKVRFTLRAVELRRVVRTFCAIDPRYIILKLIQAFDHIPAILLAAAGEKETQPAGRRFTH